MYHAMYATIMQLPAAADRAARLREHAIQELARIHAIAMPCQASQPKLDDDEITTGTLLQHLLLLRRQELLLPHVPLR
jgi:hypothetical protein